MNHVFQHSAIFLKILVIVFAVNASVSYGACCISMDTEQTESKMPCHADDDAIADHEKCCTACFVMAVPSEQTRPTVVNADNGLPTKLTLFIISNIDPPFRPPITHLS